MKKIDMHCDTFLRIHNNKNVGLRRNNLHVDIQKLEKSNSIAQFFALYFDYDKINPTDYLNEFSSMVDTFYKELEKNSDKIRLAVNKFDLEKNIKDDIISAFLAIEEGGILGNKLYNLRNAYRLGVRLITLTWNYPNYIGFPNNKYEYRNKGLTEYGKIFIEEMNNLGMIIDISHLSDKGFFDVCKLSKDPFIASHSNSRSIKNHFRNLSDDSIKKLANKGGIIGINFCSEFLGDSNISKIKDMITHIKHIKSIGGIDVLALGSDFDGISSKLEIENAGKTHKLVEQLYKSGFKENEIEKIFYKNAQRLIKDVIK
ncbi:MAG: membrane dipeptidase [Firmicutes bacterium]|nr:membrane dipeptidase [Bacillota bacterium]